MATGAVVAGYNLNTLAHCLGQCCIVRNGGWRTIMICNSSFHSLKQLSVYCPTRKVLSSKRNRSHTKLASSTPCASYGYHHPALAGSNGLCLCSGYCNCQTMSTHLFSKANSKHLPFCLAGSTNMQGTQKDTESNRWKQYSQGPSQPQPALTNCT